MTFPSIHPALARALAAREYDTPTAVQLAVLDEAAQGRDLLVSAQTGSGKTVAFGISVATTLLAGADRLAPAAEPLALIIAPTRELAMQVQRELDWLYAETGAKIVTCVGGMDTRAEGRRLAMGAHVVVGTPGRLRDHIERKRLDLSGLKAIVLDEADEMLDLGFREDLEFILETTPASRQTLLFSATMPRDIENMAKRYQRDARRIETIRRNEQHADIDYRAIKVAPNDVDNAIVNVLRFHEPRAALVFCATRNSVKRMHARLVERGFAAVALSGELTQPERTQALVAVRDGRARILVATDVAARGLDLPDLALVIHSELPNDHETLLHRSGRTGRAGKKGLCVLIVTHSQRRKAEALLGAARLQVTWASAPTAEEIHARDQDRFLADPMFTDPATEAEQSLVQHLQAGLGADAIALALVRLHRARLPAPEDLAAADRFGNERRPFRPEVSGGRGPRDTGPAREPRPRRDDGREKVWFRLNIGRDRNADPKWILPLICKAGDISKSEIGAIKIHAQETRFEIAAEHADAFAQAVQRNKHKEGHIARIGGAGDGEDAAAATAFRSVPPSAGRSARAPGGDHRAKASWGDRDRPQNGPRSGPRSFGDHKGRKDDRGGGGGQKLQRRRMSGNGKAAR